MTTAQQEHMSPLPLNESKSNDDARSIKILVLTQYFAPDGASWIPNAISEEMSRRGHSVKVLTTFPHYTYGKVSHGYRQRFGFTEMVDGIPTRRVPIFASHSQNPLGRVANYLSFAIGARLARSFAEDADVVYVYGTPATVAEPARAWSHSINLPFVYHVQDIWPESVTESAFLPHRVLTLLEKGINNWLKRVYKAAAAVIAIAPTSRNLLIDRGVPEERAYVVFNWADDPESVKRATDASGLTLLYAGNLGHFQDLETVLRAASKLSHLDGFRLNIAGGGVLEQQLRQLTTSLGIEEIVHFLGRIEREKMDEVYASAHFHIVTLKNINIFAGIIPSKFQAGLSRGVPVISSVQGDVSTIIAQNGIGYTAMPEDVDSLAAAFLQAYNTPNTEREAMSLRASQLFESNFTKKRAMDQIESVLLDVASTDNHRNENRK